jgi:hypothetical protein
VAAARLTAEAAPHAGMSAPTAEEPLPLLKPLRVGGFTPAPAAVTSGLPRGLVLSPVTVLAMAELSPNEPLPRTNAPARRERDAERWSDALRDARGIH